MALFLSILLPEKDSLRVQPDMKRDLEKSMDVKWLLLVHHLSDHPYSPQKDDLNRFCFLLVKTTCCCLFVLPFFMLAMERISETFNLWMDVISSEAGSVMEEVRQGLGWELFESRGGCVDETFTELPNGGGVISSCGPPSLGMTDIIAKVNWSDPGFVVLALLYVLVAVVSWRVKHNQSILALIFAATGGAAVSSSWIADNAAKMSKESLDTWFSSRYFDGGQGGDLFVILVWAIPNLLLTLFILALIVLETFHLLVAVKSAQLRHQARKASKAARMNGSSNGSSKKTQ